MNSHNDKEFSSLEIVYGTVVKRRTNTNRRYICPECCFFPRRQRREKVCTNIDGARVCETGNFYFVQINPVEILLNEL
jgi:hypothetical protein